MAQKANGNASRSSGVNGSTHSNGSAHPNGSAHGNVALNGIHGNLNGGANGSGTANALKSHGGARANAPTRGGNSARSRELPLRGHTERALQEYFASLNGHRPARLYDMVLHEVEEPLFRAVLDYAAGNQSRAAGILGINRGTLRKKLRALGLSE
jgi:Fis family transcriptional regulator